MQANNNSQFLDERLPNYSFLKNPEKFEKPFRIKMNHFKSWSEYILPISNSQVVEKIKYQIQASSSSPIEEFYKDLEYDHSFIQWIFPNFFTSAFNYRSKELSLEERNKIIGDDNCKSNLWNHYGMFLRFLGIIIQEIEKPNNKICNQKINDEPQKRIKQNENSSAKEILSPEKYVLRLENERQFYKCIKINMHNQFRIQRVMASLSVLGFRKHALKLQDFLLQEIKNQNIQSEYFTIQLKNYGQTRELELAGTSTDNLYGNDEILSFYIPKDHQDFQDIDLTKDKIFEKIFSQDKLETKQNNNRNSSKKNDQTVQNSYKRDLGKITNYFK